MSERVTFSNPATMPPTRGYTHVVEIEGPQRIVYIAGQLGFTPDGMLAEDFRGQAMQAFANLKAALASVGGGFEHVVKITNFFTDMDNLPAFFAVRDSFVNTKAPPSSTAIEISRLAVEGALFEIEAVAVLPARKSAAARRKAPRKTSRKTPRKTSRKTPAKARKRRSR